MISASELFQYDWHTLQIATQHWVGGGSPYGALPPVNLPGAFAYPPTALTWMALFLPLGDYGYFAWNILQIGIWFALIRKTRQLSQALLLCWAPLLMHLILGQTTLLAVLALWWVFVVPRRSWLCGFLLAFACTKPQVALLPLLWLLWHTRRDTERLGLYGGLFIGTLLLAAPPTWRNPHIWSDWFLALGAYRRQVQQTTPWQGFGLMVLAPAFWLWRTQTQKQNSLNATNDAPHWESNPWPWWIGAAMFPQTSIYSIVALLPTLRPVRGYWNLVGLLFSSLLIGPVTGFTLPLLLSGQILAAWMINGGPHPAPIHVPIHDSVD